MDFIKKAFDSSTSNDDGQKKPDSQPQHPHDSTSPTELLSSAKVLAGAAQASFKHENVDKPKVADAADDVLHAGSKYGKLEEKGYGQYVEKADSYLHKLGSGHGSAPPPAGGAQPPAPADSGEGAKSEGGHQ